MKKVVVISVVLIFAFCFSGCGESGMSYDEYQKAAQMEDELNHYKALDEAHILTDDTAVDVGMALGEKYGEEEIQEIMDAIFDNTPELGDYVY